jgi:serine phosphatase RsbU (regulator of sigma subunit)
VSDNNGEFTEIKGDKQPIGKYASQDPFTTHTIALQKGDVIYLFTDGYQDQFGGENHKTGGKKFKASNLRALLLSIQNKSMQEQHDILLQRFENWRGDLEQIDDVCIVGVRI